MGEQVPAQTWDAEAYGRHFGFVPGFGRGVVALLDPQPGERIVDLGCGDGVLTAAIAEAGAEVTGVDADAAMVAAARAHFPGLRFELADAGDFTVGRPADAVFSNAALHWMTEPDRVLRRVAAALRPGGRFVAEMGGHGNVARIEGALRAALAAHGLPPDRQPHPWYFPTAAEYAAKLEAHGFEVHALWNFDRPTPLEPGELSLRGWLTMFARPFLEALPPAERKVVPGEVEAAMRRHLYADGRWHLDYRRLRFLAVRL